MSDIKQKAREINEKELARTMKYLGAMKKIKVLSLFDGISCARVALDRLGYKDVEYYASEIDKYAIQISQKNWPEIIQLGSIIDVRYGMQWNDEKYPNWEIDLLIGGSPCQDLSIAKKDRKGLDGERSGLFWEYVRILKEVKPKYFVLENVASMPNEAKDTITESLGVEPIMINASLVSAQNRKRLFWFGERIDTFECKSDGSDNPPILHGESFYSQVKIPQPEDKGILLKDILEKNVDEKYEVKGCASRTFPRIPNGEKRIKQIEVRKDGKANSMTLVSGDSMVRIGQIGKGGQGDRIYSPDGKSVGLSALGGGRGAKTGLYAIVPEATKKGYAVATDGQSIDLSFPTSKTRRGRMGDKVKNLMTSQNIGVFTDSIIRKLTPIECERLQSLDDGYTEGVSNTQRYKALGNAFNVEVVKHILSFAKF